MIDEEEFERNINNFIEKHGIDGFLTLYFSKYLFKILKNEIKSKSQGKGISNDPGVIFYFKGEGIENFSELDHYEDKIYEECKEKAREMVSNLKDDEKFKPLFEGDFEKLDDPELKDRFKTRMHDLFEKWEEEES